MIEHKGFDRLVNFTDGVVAIAATLLILPVAEAASKVRTNGADDFLRTVAPTFLMFLLSFVIIANFWLEHHRLFRRIDKFDSFMIVLNLAWMFGIVVMPVPTALIVKGDSHNVLAIAMYIGTMLWISLAQTLMGNHVRLKPELEHGEVATNSRLLGDFYVTVLLAVALVIGLVFPEVGLFPLFIVFLVPLFVYLTHRARKTRTSV